MAAVANILKLNGSEATAQQVYDAFMGGIVRIDQGSGVVLAPVRIYWENEDGTQTNPAAVTYVKVLDGSDSIVTQIGTRYQEK